jgi:hypothetical protein
MLFRNTGKFHQNTSITFKNNRFFIAHSVFCKVGSNYFKYVEVHLKYKEVCKYRYFISTLEVNVLNTNRPSCWLITLSEPTMASQIKMVLKLEVRRSFGGEGDRHSKVLDNLFWNFSRMLKIAAFLRVTCGP